MTATADAVAERAHEGVELLGPDAARAVTEQIRTATVRALDALADVEDSIRTAYAGRAWAALGYESWDAYCAAEFSQTRLWASVDERHARTVALRDAGLSQRAIAAVLGVSQPTVSSDVSRALSTDQDRSVDSGDRTVAGLDGRTRPSSRPSSAQVLERQVQVVHLRGEGLTQTQIAEQLGVSQATVSADETTMTSTLALAGPVAEEAVELAASDPEMDVVRLAEVLGVELAVSTTPQAHLEASGKAAARDLSSAVDYLREEVVFTDAWVRFPQAVARVSAVLAVPVAEAVVAGASVLARLDRSGLSRSETRRAGEAITRACSILSGLAVPMPDVPMPRR